MISLLATRRFLPLFITQFLGAFNDNVFKNALVVLITYKLASNVDGNAQMLVTLAAGLFILPFFIFSATAGQLADKYDRAQMARATKIWEMIIMMIASAGFYFGNIYFLLFVLFCLGVQATFFGPIKYALLPQHLHEGELIAGNGYIEAGTFLAILLGTICGGLLIMNELGTQLIAGAIIVCAALGYASSRFIPKAPGPMPELKIHWNIARETWRIIGHDRHNHRVFVSILGISWFWLIGATFLSQFPTYAKETLGADATVVTLFLTVFSVGIGIGSLLCNRLLGGEVSSKYVPAAALGITLFTVDLFFASSHSVSSGTLIDVWEFLNHIPNVHILLDLLAIAICGGVYIVPLYAIMQHESAPNSRARTIASNNVMNALFMVIAAVGTMIMLKAGFSIPHVFLTIAILNGAATIVIARIRYK